MIDFGKSHWTRLLLIATLVLMPSLVSGAEQPLTEGLTAIAGLEVGQHTLKARPTGCTVVLAKDGAVGGVDVRGSAPGTRETDLLNPVDTVQKVYGIVLAGGSAFGLDAASGVMRYLEEKNIGFDAGVAKVPIVPSAILFDLEVGNPKIHPGADCGYQAAKEANAGPIAVGSVGAGAGATVGKLLGAKAMMKGGVGTAAITLKNGLKVAALVAVNSVGDIVDPASGKIVAGARRPNGAFADARKLIASGALLPPVMGPKPGTNTTIGVVATNARLTKAQATKMAQMGQDGLARTIYPSHTPFDGDTLFALATGTRAKAVGPEELTEIGALAAEVTSRAILNAVGQATGLPGIPSVNDLKRSHP